MATVFVINPTFVQLHLVMDQWMRGEIVAGHDVVNVPYVNLPFLANVEDGAEMLDTMLAATEGYKIVYGHSLGAQVAAYWLREYGPTSSLDPGDIEFILTGNASRKYNGVTYGGGPLVDMGLGWMVPFVAKYLTDVEGVPEDTPYFVTDFSRQYDMFSDFPNILNAAAWANIFGGQVIHAQYFQVGLGDDGNVHHVEGNITYVLSPTFPVGGLGTIAVEWGPLMVLVDRLDTILRTEIEKGYRRPAYVPGGGGRFIGAGHVGLGITRRRELDDISHTVDAIRIL